METRIRHPYRAGFPAFLGLIGLSGGIALVAGLLTWLNVAELEAIAGIAGAFAALWLLIMIITWLMGLRQMGLVRRFLASDRPLVRWTYTFPEWEALKETRKEETQGDWRLALGCLTVIMALAGGLTGALIGFDEGVGEGIAGGLAGVVVGGLFGAVLGIIVGGGNALAAWRAYQTQEPEQVALGAGEIYANEAYFRSDENRTIRGARLENDKTATVLILNLWNPKPRGSSAETWEVFVPPRMIRDVEAILPRIAVGAQKADERDIE